MRKLYYLASMLLIGAMGISSAFAQPCTPTHTTSCTSNDYIDNFSTTGGLVNISNLSSGCNGNTNNYIYNSNMTVSGAYGDVISFSVQSGYWSQSFRIWIDWNDDGDFTDPGEDVWNSGSSSSTSAFTGSFTIPNGASPGANLRLRVRSQYCSPHPISDPCANTQCGYGETEDYNVYVIPPVKDDAGVAEINTPGTGNCTLGSISTTVTINNLGTDTLRSCTVNWSVNGSVQTPVSVSNLAVAPLGGTHGTITLGNFTYSDGDSLCVWTTNPNNVQDSFPANDTICKAVYQALGGTFTIGGVSPDYDSITAATTDLVNRGICSTVVFNIRGGTYNEQVMVGNILGASATNTITFKAESDTSLVEVTWNSAAADANYTFGLIGSQYVYVDGLTISATGGSFGTTARFDKAENCSFTNCIMNGANGYNNDMNNIASSGGENIEVMDCEVNNGYHNAYFDGSDMINVSGNTMLDAYYGGIFFNSTGVFYANENYITSQSATTYSDGAIEVSNADGACQIIGNTLHWKGYYGGVYAYNLNGKANEQPLIANNMVWAGDGTGNVWSGIYIYGGYANIVYNTVAIYANGYGYNGIYVGGGANTVMNNMVFDTTGYNATYYASLYYSGNFAVLESDYNNVFTNRNFGYQNTGYASLSAWQTATGLDMNSSTIDPGYMSYDSMRTCNDSLDGTANPLSYVSDDYDGDGRSTTNPDIGADEWIGSAPGSFSAGDDAIVCDGKVTTIGLEASGTFLWSTGDTTATIDVTDEGSYIVTMTSGCGAAHADTVEVVDVTPTASYTTTYSFHTGQFTNTSQNGITYMWVVHTSPNDTFYSKDLTYVFPNNGPFQVDLTVYNDCDTISTSQTWTGFVGVNERSLDNSISLMPNPVTDLLTIQFEGIDGDVTVEMLNIQGQVVHSDRYMNVSSPKTIDVSSLKKGMYIVKFITNDEIATKQVIVQ